MVTLFTNGMVWGFMGWANVSCIFEMKNIVSGLNLVVLDLNMLLKCFVYRNMKTLKLGFHI